MRLLRHGNYTGCWHSFKMNWEIIKILESLKESPSTEEVDHLHLLGKIYNEYANGITGLEQIVHFYLNGFDDLPTLKEKHLWNQPKFIEARKEFVDAHNELIQIIDSTINNLKSNNSNSCDHQLSKVDF